MSAFSLFLIILDMMLSFSDYIDFDIAVLALIPTFLPYASCLSPLSLFRMILATVSGSISMMLVQSTDDFSSNAPVNERAGLTSNGVRMMGLSLNIPKLLTAELPFSNTL